MIFVHALRTCLEGKWSAATERSLEKMLVDNVAKPGSGRSRQPDTNVVLQRLEANLQQARVDIEVLFGTEPPAYVGCPLGRKHAVLTSRSAHCGWAWSCSKEWTHVRQGLEVSPEGWCARCLASLGKRSGGP